MNRDLVLACVGVLIAIAATTALDVIGLTVISALVLIPLTLFFWFVQRFGRQEMGLTLGRGKDYGIALLYPLLVLGVIGLIAWFAGVINTSETAWEKFTFVVGMGLAIGPIMVLLTEEGFFRGWLWACCKRSGMSETAALLATTIAFTLWHLSAATLSKEFRVSGSQIPIYLTNVVVLSLIWGLMRSISGSALVPSVSHAVWNPFAYELFGFGTEKLGALGIQQKATYNPESGVLGIVFNLLFLAGMWIWFKKREKPKESESD